MRRRHSRDDLDAATCRLRVQSEESAFDPDAARSRLTRQIAELYGPEPVCRSSDLAFNAEWENRPQSPSRTRKDLIETDRERCQNRS